MSSYIVDIHSNDDLGRVIQKCNRNFQLLATKQNKQGTSELDYNNTMLLSEAAAYTDEALESKQDVLTFDSVPTSGSSNPVASEGIKSYVDNADDVLQSQIDALGEPFRLLDFSRQVNITIPVCTSNIANTGIPNIDIDLNAIDPTGDLAADFAVVSMAKYEVYDATTGGNHINCWPVCQFSMNGQTILRIRMMCAGTSDKVVRRIQGSILLKRR